MLTLRIVLIFVAPILSNFLAVPSYLVPQISFYSVFIVAKPPVIEKTLPLPLPPPTTTLPVTNTITLTTTITKQGSNVQKDF